MPGQQGNIIHIIMVIICVLCYDKWVNLTLDLVPEYDMHSPKVRKVLSAPIITGVYNLGSFQTLKFQFPDHKAANVCQATGRDKHCTLCQKPNFVLSYYFPSTVLSVLHNPGIVRIICFH